MVYFNRGGYRYNPRKLGLNPRAQKTNPRALGTNKKAHKTYNKIAADIATFYGSEIARLDRRERILWALERIELLRHEGSRDNALFGQLNLAIYSERKDREYIEKTKRESVNYSDHLGSFYWKRLRYRKFIAVDWRCERCSVQTNQLAAHHRHYATLGYEEIEDLEALCSECHRLEHTKRDDRWRSRHRHHRKPRLVEDGGAA